MNWVSSFIKLANAERFTLTSVVEIWAQVVNIDLFIFYFLNNLGTAYNRLLSFFKILFSTKLSSETAPLWATILRDCPDANSATLQCRRGLSREPFAATCDEHQEIRLDDDLPPPELHRHGRTFENPNWGKSEQTFS